MAVVRTRRSAPGPRRLVVIAAKVPKAGRVKTRLTSTGEVSAGEAAMIAGAALRDTVALCAHPCVGAEVRLALDGDEADLPVGLSRGGALRTFPQGEGTLGERLTRLFSGCFAEAPSRPVCVVGGDSPHLPPALLAEAFGRLSRPGADAVLGPSEDGGYYLIGMRRPAPELFADVPWSTERVLSETLARAADAKIAVALLPRWYDIDTPEDLRRLRRDLARGTAHAPETDAALGRLETEL